MEITEELILCRLCLSIISDNDFETVKDTDRKMFEMVVPEIKLEQDKEHKICCKCSKTLLKSYEFKWTYLKSNTRNIFPKFSTSLQNIVSNLGEKVRDTIVKKEEPFELCSFCLERIDLNMNKEVNQNEEDFYLKMILEKCFSELDFSESSNVQSCNSCLDLLEKQFAFVCSCLHTDQKIKNYYSFHGKFNQKKVHLHQIMTFNLKKENERFYSRNETETMWSDETSSISKLEPIYEQEDIETSESLKDTLKIEEIEIKTEEKLLNKNLMHDTAPGENIRKPDKTEMFYCQNCSYQTRFRHNIIRHCFTYKESSEIKMYKCELCAFESKFKCALRDHRLNHKNSSELSLYKCELCTYETTRKGHLSSHMLVHKPKSEVIMYKCEMCPYESRHKGALKVHILTHKDSSNTVMYKCDMCTYETKRKGDLKIHNASRHKDLQNASM